MRSFKHGLVTAAREHLLGSKPITRLEALIFYGVVNLPNLVRDLRREGWTVRSRLIPYAAAARRVNEHAILQPPNNLPVREIQLTEYWVSR